MTTSLRRVLAGVVTLAACLAGAEGGRRVLDGYQLTRSRLVRNPDNIDLTWSEPASHSAAALLAGIPADPETPAAWFSDRPPDVVHPVPAWANERRALGRDAGANYVWNAAGWNDPNEVAYFDSVKTALEDVFAFRAPGNAPRPRYRFYPGIQTDFGFANQFGWKSREIALAKPPGVIRIAMLGDSTTNRYPDMVEHWLNLWAARSQPGVRFEIINAARPASDALDAAAIFDFEIGPFDPDYVVVYGFANKIASADALIPVPPGLPHGKPGVAALQAAGTVHGWSTALSRRLEPLTPWSAAAIFLQRRIAGGVDDSLAAEPSKPRTYPKFPRDIDENSPAPDAIAARGGGYVMGLDEYLQALNAIDRLGRRRGTRVFVSTFRVLAFDGLQLPKGGPESDLYKTLNEGVWWPYTYAEIHRLTSFFNRTLRAWAMGTGNGVIPVDEQLPWLRELYVDGIHERPAGEALHAWIVLQQLLPDIRENLRRHRLPHQSPDAPARYSEQYWKIDRVKTIEAIASAALPPPADEVPGAFLLSTLSAADSKATVVAGAVPAITTSTEPSGYAAAVPVDPAVGATLHGKGRIEVRLKVTAGRLSVGVLNKSAQKFLASSAASQSPDVQTILLSVDDLSDVGSVMISNDRAGEHASSTGEVHAVALKKLK